MGLEEMMQVQQELDRFREDVLYVEENRTELLKRYPDRWIAVYNKEVVEDAKEPSRLIRKLRKQGITTGDVVLRYLTENDELLIL